MLTTEEHIAYWKKLAEADLEVARGFLQRGYDLHYCLFFGHMSLEKLLKGLIVAATQAMPPRIHDLLLLAERAKLTLNEELTEKFDTFNSFNLETRYPDYKLAFYKRCTPEFTAEKFSQIEEAYSWLQEQFPQPLSETSSV
jgi:HEPN domain-containing protein